MAATLQTFGGGTTDFILDPGNDAKPPPNTPYTIIDGQTMLPATGLVDGSGAAVTQLTSDADGRYAGGAMLEGVTYWLSAVGAKGPFTAGPQVSTTALANVVAMGPQLDTIAASAAASAFSAKTAQAAAEAAASGATAPTATAIDSRLGGNSAGLVPRVAANETRLAFDITKIRPTFLTTLQLARASVMQTAVKEPVSGDFYVSQAVPGTTGTRETMQVSRVSSAGVLLDSMQLEDAGHGTVIAVQRVNGKVHVWWCHALAPTGAAVTPGAGANDLLRFEYKAQTAAWTRDTLVATVMPKFGGDYVTVALDEANDVIVYRTTTANTETYTKRKLSEVQAGTNTTYGTITLPSNPPTMQGFASIDGDLYRYTGDGNDATNPALITRYSWATGQQTGQVSTSNLGVDPDGTVAGGYREPEGIAIYRDPASGLPHLTAGVTTGPSNRRTYTLFMFAPVGGDQFRGVQLQQLEGMAQVGKGNRARRMDPANTSLHTLTTPGWWYLTGAEFGTMTDRPADSTSSSGHWLLVGGLDANTAQTQILIRSTTTGQPQQWTRTIDQTSSTAGSVWARVNLQAPLTPAATLPTGVTSMHGLTTPGWYYLTTTQYTAMTDRPSDFVSSGHFIHVSGTDGGTGNAQVQTLYRNTIGSAPMTWTRVIDQTTPTNQTKWQRYTLTEVAYAP